MCRLHDQIRIFIRTTGGHIIQRENSEEIDKLKKFSMLLVEEKQSAMKREERFNERIKSTESEVLVSTVSPFILESVIFSDKLG